MFRIITNNLLRNASKSPQAFLRTVRCCQSKPNNPTEPTPDWEPIYRFKPINVARAFSRLKIYQTGITLGLTCYNSYLYTENMMEGSLLGLTTGSLVLATGMLFLMGDISQKTVGVLFINRCKTKIKVAHLTFWGNRQDDIIPIEDVKNFGDVDQSRRDFYYCLERFDSSQYFYVSKKYGLILNPEAFELVFGTDKLV